SPPLPLIACVEHHAVSDLPSGATSTAEPCDSMQQWVMMEQPTSVSLTTFASWKARSTSPTLFAFPGVADFPAACGSSSTTLWGRTSYSTRIRRTASRAISSLSAATIATSLKATLSSVPGGATTSTVTTPAIFCAASASTDFTLACPYGQVVYFAQSMRGRLVS